LPHRVVVATVLLAAVGAIAFGTAVRAPCVARTGADDFKWCATQFTELYIVESIGGGRLPYLDECDPVAQNPCDEYPVLTMYAMWLSGRLTDDIQSFFYADAGLMLVAALVVSSILASRVGMRALYVAFAPALVLFGLMNWDLPGVVFMVVAVEAFLRGRPRLAGASLGLATAVKVFPALLVLPFAADLVSRGRRHEAQRLAAWAVAAWIAVNLPFAVLAPKEWSTFIRFNGQRPPDIDSLWYAVCHRVVGEVPCLSTSLTNGLSLLAFASAAVLVWLAKSRREPGFERWTFGFPLLVVFFLANKVYSPQYDLWLLPWVALVVPDLRLFVALSLTEVVIFVTRYQIPLEPPALAFQLAVLVRDAILVAWVIAWIRRPSAGLRDAPADDQGSSRAESASASVTGSRQAKRSQT
jgi:hypothetical protein